MSLACVYALECVCVWFLQFDEEFSARQEAQAEQQKQEEKIKELEGKITTLQSQVRLYLL